MFIAVMKETLARALRPRYLVFIEERVYVERGPEQPVTHFVPDLPVAGERVGTPPAGAPLAGAQSGRPIPVPVKMPEETTRETFLELRMADSRDLVTIVELLSPANKRWSSSGRAEYLHKRDTALVTEINLVELDLLRGGERLPMAAPLPRGDGFAIVCSANRLPLSDVWPLFMRVPLPTIAVPLRADENVALDLQTVFDTVYDRSAYDVALDYGRLAEPRLTSEEAAWVAEILAARGQNSV